MVRLSVVQFCRLAEKIRSSATQKPGARPFVDSFKIVVHAGRGGCGLPRYGGPGGRGGNVYVVGNKTLKDLQDFKRPGRGMVVAGHGEDSRQYKLVGKAGHDAFIECPAGVDVLSENGVIMGQIKDSNERLLVAKGGRGGCRETQWNGMEGERMTIFLDLKLIADIGFVGYPNAGKSSLLKSISRSSPKIANYPFTTLKPNLGVMEYPDHRQISVADLPGLIEGAHLNHGLGYQFLKHIEKTKALLFVVDVNGFQLAPQGPHRTAFETLLYLMKEISMYNDYLLSKPSLLVITKMDTPKAKSRYDKFLDQLQRVLDGDWEGIHPTLCNLNIKEFDDILSVSCKSAENIPLLREQIRSILDTAAAATSTGLDTKQRSYQEIIQSQRQRNSGEDLDLV